MQRRIVGTALCALALTVTAACGGDGEGDGRPSAEEVSKVFTSEDNPTGFTVPDEQADCIAKLFVESDLSDETLNALVELDEGYEGSKADEKVIADLGTKIATECISTSVPTETPTP